MLIKLARKEIYTDKPNFMNAFLNLQDLKKIAKDKHDKEEMYKLYSELFFAVGNERLSKNALFRGCCANDNGGYYILDYTKFRYTEMLEEDEDLITLYNSKMNDSDIINKDAAEEVSPNSISSDDNNLDDDSKPEK